MRFPARKPAQKLRFEIDESYFGAKKVRGLVLALSLRKEVEVWQIKHRYSKC